MRRMPSGGRPRVSRRDKAGAFLGSPALSLSPSCRTPGRPRLCTPVRREQLQRTWLQKSGELGAVFVISTPRMEGFPQQGSTRSGCALEGMQGGGPPRDLGGVSERRPEGLVTKEQGFQRGPVPLCPD